MSNKNKLRINRSPCLKSFIGVGVCKTYWCGRLQNAPTALTPET